jgi:CrcB protein
MSAVPEESTPEGSLPKDGTLEDVVELPPKLFHPLSWEILALLMSASVFGVLARLGLDALTSYEGQSIFPLAYVQGVGCLVMGFCLALKVPISEWYVSPAP